jgi:tetratricopeptide (TPR) repeat protein
MTAPNTEKKIFIDFEKELYNDRLQELITPTLNRFQKILKLYSAFNVFFYGLISAEIIYLLFHLTFLVQNFVLAIHLALIFATIFSFFTLRLYFQTKKVERCFALKNDFIKAVERHINYQEKNPEHYLIVASICCKLAAHLHGQEYRVYQFSPWLNYLSSSMEKFSCWCHWQDIHFMKELFLQGSIDEHTKLVQLEPTNLEVHVGLANAYVMLSGLYVDPRIIEGLDEDRWIPPNKYTEGFNRKFRSAAEKAIEEFKILSDYAPHDPWVHAQLAFSYRDLKMSKEEIKEYEIILELCPEDKETLFKLGKLYFEQGQNAKGLQIYETLKKSNYKKAENLIQFYGVYTNAPNQFKQMDLLDIG